MVWVYVVWVYVARVSGLEAGRSGSSVDSTCGGDLDTSLMWKHPSTPTTLTLQLTDITNACTHSVRFN